MITRLRSLAERAGRSFPGRVVRKFGEDNGPGQAVLIAWNSLTALFPIVLALAAVAGFILGTVGIASERVYEVLLAVVPDDAGRAEALKAVEGVRQRSGVFALVALAGFVWSGTALFGAIEQAFDLIFHVERRGFLGQKLMALGMMAIFTVLALLAVASSAALPVLTRLPGLPTQLAAGPVALLLQLVIGSASGFLLFFAMYYVVPNRRQKARETWVGALVAGIGFELVTLLFPTYIKLNQGINQYGKTFAFLFVLLTFFYLFGLITMLGIEIIAVLYPVPIPQPDRAQALAPGGSGPGAEPAGAERPRGGPSPAAATARGRDREPEAKGAAPRRPGGPAWRRALFCPLAAVIGLAAARRRDLA